MKRYHLSTDRKIFGVCGGLAEYWDIDPTLVRVGTVLVAFLTAGLPVCIAYVVMYFAAPEAPSSAPPSATQATAMPPSAEQPSASQPGNRKAAYGASYVVPEKSRTAKS